MQISDFSYLTLFYFFMNFSYLTLIFQVKVKRWMNGVEEETFAGLSASFGSLIPTSTEEAQKLPIAYSSPLTSCTRSSSKVCFNFFLSGFVVL